jgi:hypothetical protein
MIWCRFTKDGIVACGVLEGDYVAVVHGDPFNGRWSARILASPRLSCWSRWYRRPSMQSVRTIAITWSDAPCQRPDAEVPPLRPVHVFATVQCQHRALRHLQASAGRHDGFADRIADRLCHDNDTGCGKTGRAERCGTFGLELPCLPRVRFAFARRRTSGKVRADRRVGWTGTFCGDGSGSSPCSRRGWRWLAADARPGLIPRPLLSIRPRRPHSPTSRPPCWARCSANRRRRRPRWRRPRRHLGLHRPRRQRPFCLIS